MADINNQFPADIGEKIRKARKDKKLTIAKLAEKAGLSDKCVGSIENGQTAPNMKTLYALCVAMQISMDELFSLKLPGEEVELSSLARSLNSAELNVLISIGYLLRGLRMAHSDQNFTSREADGHDCSNM
jgi:transcriptional regulator with XRE-family HTH domain